MKIQYFSDLHIDNEAEFLPVNAGADVVVLAGDLCNGNRSALREGLRWFSETFKEQHKIYVMGNHESYGCDIAEQMMRVKSLCDELDIKSLIYTTDSYVIEGVTFVGGTLWTDFELFGQDKKHDSMSVASQCMNDFRFIKLNNKEFTPQDSVKMHQRTVAAIEDKVAASSCVVVVTHHCPHPKSVHKKYDGDILNAAFCSDLEWLIKKYPQIKHWIHGHTHSSFEYQIESTTVYCNPKGYCRYKIENPEFDRSKIFTLVKEEVS